MTPIHCLILLSYGLNMECNRINPIYVTSSYVAPSMNKNEFNYKFSYSTFLKFWLTKSYPITKSYLIYISLWNMVMKIHVSQFSVFHEWLVRVGEAFDGLFLSDVRAQYSILFYSSGKKVHCAWILPETMPNIYVYVNIIYDVKNRFAWKKPPGS